MRVACAIKKKLDIRLYPPNTNQMTRITRIVGRLVVVPLFLITSPTVTVMLISYSIKFVNINSLIPVPWLYLTFLPFSVFVSASAHEITALGPRTLYGVRGINSAPISRVARRTAALVRRHDTFSMTHGTRYTIKGTTHERAHMRQRSV